jgi:O-antigen biosynthesis protein WbqP
MKRALDFVAAAAAIAILALPSVVVALAIKATSTGPVLYWSRRVGRSGKTFSMPKFRTMRTDTPELATDLLADPASYLTPVGGFLRKTSIDEIPQLWSILVGDMSVVGPRPALPSQQVLMKLRRESGVDALRPGLTGWAQVNGRDDVSDDRKAVLDAEYLRRASLLLDLRIVWMTAWKVLRREGVSH